ncbi:MAG TPA: hypothetical protein PKA37_12165, partial [Planctomycetota bacterium]|nr:hypothetical protein [Planctomycetota bacterium]
ALAQNPNALLVVIDDSAQVHGTELERQRKESETKYLSLCAEARALRARAADLPMRAATLADLRRKMEVLQKGGHAATLNAYRAINRYDTLWRAIQKSAQEGIARVDAASGDPLVLADLNLGLQAENDSSTDPLKRAHAQLIRVAESLQRHVQEAVAQARREMSAVQEGADAVAWRTTVEQSVKRYESVTRNLAEAGIANPDEYGDLVKRTAILEQEISSLQHLGQESEKRAQEASAELQRYRELRSELTKRRQAFVLKTSSELIRVTISAHKDREGLEDYVRQSLGILSFDRDIAALSEKSAPDSGADWTFDLLDAQVKKLRDLLIDGSMAWEGVDRRFDAQLRKVTPERIDRLALYLPEDQVTVEFRRNSTSPSYQPLHQGSPGQQTAALLAFVLGYGDEPIILDQPEDDLDNTLIYEVLVQRLREQKKRRQVIIVTHNANIVVHGDAELVISLEAGGGQTHIKCEGGLQEKATREEICRVMEGGPEAFKSRYRRIALGGRSDG